MKAILFVGHGSKDKEGNEQVREFINEMKPAIDPSFLVETCFLEFETPTVDQGIDTCVMKGASHVYVIPMMLLQAGHSKIHIPHCIDEAKKKYPHVEFTYGRPIGIHDSALEICISRLAEIGLDIESGDPDTAIILLGRGGSDPDANSDLYKITRLLWEKLNYPIVEPAFMGVTTPLIDEVIHRCLLLGAKKIVILPYFLFTGVLIKRLEKIVQGYKERYKDHQFALAEYFGFHEKLQDILMDRVQEALDGDVKMNCDTCQYRIGVAENVGHHHHHHHDHHDHDNHHHHNHGDQIRK
ncbi:sirohydrochlorin chelatase [Schinkia azotoformans]|uniref:sirohydrochlorin chelatase n=1 Tax=Schinkia azotoformans TaxID=1454 RepID=UPI002DBC3A92|nr:sirohydrochlorin chelatase [Schinkia azotoformans]MEC1721559.1 sirohydrochlorin chelatase [Schinkia azotoformans]MED4413642.1 sirohydrochlorin chelatase [Schinkia azotoformans]